VGASRLRVNINVSPTFKYENRDLECVHLVRFTSFMALLINRRRNSLLSLLCVRNDIQWRSLHGAITELCSPTAQYENNYKLHRNIFNHVRKSAERNYKLRRVGLSVRMEQLSSHWTDFHEISYFSIFETLSKTFNLRQNLAIMTGLMFASPCIIIRFK